MARRSILFSPGDQEKLLRKAPESGADVVVYDLEDAVVPTEKAAARSIVTTVLSELHTECEVCVRINPLEGGGLDDIDALASAVTPDSIMLPKVDSAATAETAITELTDAGIDVPLLALLETAGGVLDAKEIAGVDGVDAVILGAEDLSAAIGATRTFAGDEISYARQRTVLAGSHAGIDAIDTLHTDFGDLDGLRADTDFSITLGFDGKLAIHPNQVAVINEAFTPDPDEVDWANRVLEARDEAEADGLGVFAVDNEMIDAPLIKQAETILERADETQK